MDYVSTSLVPLFPTMLWNTKKLDDHHYRVNTTRNPKIDWPEDMDEDPFGLQWEIDLCFFILHFYVGDLRLQLELTEVLSAQRVSHPDMFGYHVYFNAKTVPCGVHKLPPASCSEVISANIFAEIFISRKNISEFVPEVTCYEIMKPLKYEDFEKVERLSCYYCCQWVPHPKSVKSIKFKEFPNYNPLFDPEKPPGFHVCKQPWSSYTSPNLQRHVPKLFNGEGLPSKRLRKFDGVEAELARFEKWLECLEEEKKTQSLETECQNLQDTHLST